MKDKHDINLGAVASARSMNTAKTPTLEEMQRISKEITLKQMTMLSNLVSGIKVIPDDSGLMCGPNEYVVWMGRRLYDQLKEHVNKQLISTPPQLNKTEGTK